MLKDILCPRPRLLLVGINPGLRSAALGHHFAGPGNPFWRLLHASRITPVPLSYADDRRLPEFGIALTNLCPRASRSAAELTAAELDAGRRALARKCARLQPGVVAFVGLSIYQAYFRLPRSGGAGAKTERLAEAPVFVVPNPSGLNASFPGWDQKLRWYRKLAQFTARHAPPLTKATFPQPRSAELEGGHAFARPGLNRSPEWRSRRPARPGQTDRS